MSLLECDPKRRKTVFVHIDARGCYAGNGGLVMLTQFANKLAEMGYPTFIFDQYDRLNLKQFRWLSLGAINFNIAPIDFVFRNHKFDYVIVTNWLNVLLPWFFKKTGRTLISNKRAIANLRYWCHSELLREGSQYEEVRKFCLNYLDRIAINNRTLEQYYKSIGFNNIIYLENWIRDDLFNFDGVVRKILNSIGHQPDRYDRENEYLPTLKSYFGKDSILLCEGNQYEVSERMKAADFYLFWNYPSPSIRMFNGESFGMSLYEAMACGCVCIAIDHEGNKFLHGDVQLVNTISEAINVIAELMNNPEHKEDMRRKGLRVIENKFRFDEARVRAIEAWLG